MAELLYGFRNMRDVALERVTPDLIPTVTRAVEETFDQHNEDLDTMMDLFVRRVTEPQLKFEAPPLSTRLQKLDEDGRALPIKPRTEFYQVGFPIYDLGRAYGSNRITRIKQSVQKVNDTVAMLLDADTNTMSEGLIGRLLSNETFVFDDDVVGPVNVMPLANNDAVRYTIRAGQLAGEQANHYYAQAAGLTDLTNPFETLRRRLMRRVENRGARVVVFFNENLQDDVENLGNFYEDDQDTDLSIPDNVERLTGSLGAAVPGEVIGKVGKVWAAVWPRLPDDYFIMLALGGSEKPLALRQHEEEELQGFRAVAERNDHPYFERQYERHAGFGVWNRVGAIVGRFGNGVYTTPTIYKQPMI